MTNYSAAQRRAAAAKGHAMRNPSGGPPRFPIEKPQDVTNAIRLVGQVPASQQAAVKAYIRRRAAALGCSDRIPKSW